MYRTMKLTWPLVTLGCVICMLPIAQVDAQELVDPKVKARLNREFAEAHPQPGDYLPSISLPVLGKDYETGINRAAYGEVKLVVTASLTCPKTRQHFPALQALKKKYDKQLGLTIVYVLEAHPEHDLCPYLGIVDVTEANLRDKILHRQPITFEGRVKLAEQLSEMYPIDATILVDSLDNPAWRCLGKSPNLALLTTYDNRVLLRQGWLEPDELDAQIQKQIPQERLRRQKFESEIRTEPVKSKNAELAEIVRRLSPNYDSQWEFVRWLESASSDRLELLFKKYTTIVNEPLSYGKHDSLQTSILQIMIGRSDLEKVRMVVEAGADINLKIQGKSSIQAAIEANSLPIVEYLLGQRVDLKSDLDRLSLIHTALWNGGAEIAKRLAQETKGLDLFSHSGLGNLDQVRSAIQRNPSCGLTFGPQGQLPISYAIINNQWDVVKLLIDKECVVDVGNTRLPGPITLATENPDPKYLAALLKTGLSIKHENSRAVLAALNQHRFEHLCLLLDQGAKLNVSNKGLKAIHLAIDRKLSIEFLVKLIEHGANIDDLTIGYEDDGCGPSDPNSTEETPLHIAVRRLLPDQTKLLIEKGAKLNQLDQVKLSPLAAAILTTLETESSQGLETIKALLDGGADPNALDSKSQNIFLHLNSIAQRKLVESRPSKLDRDTEPARKPFEIAPTQYRGHLGLDISKVEANPIANQIRDLLAEQIHRSERK